MISRSDVVESPANWALPVSLAASNIRWYALDGTSGSDSNAGFSDVSAAAAGAVAVKTAAQLNKILPINGKGRSVSVLVKSGTYAELTSFLVGRSGYYYFLCRATCTDSTANSTAFLDDTADRNMNGNVTATGMNAAGYHPTGAPTNQVVQCLTLAGGAPGFPAEVPISLPGGARLRFDINTTTSALRGIRRSVVKVSGTDTLTLDKTLPAVPVAGDTFYLEMPGALFLAIEGSCDGMTPVSTGGNYCVSGLHANGTTSGANRIQLNGPWAMAQCWYDASNSSTLRGPGFVNVSGGYVLTDGTVLDTGGASRSGGSFSVTGTAQLTQTGGSVGLYAGSISLGRTMRGELENSFVAVGGVSYGLMSGTAQDSNNTDPDCIGTNPSGISAGRFACRILGPGTIAGLQLEADATICALDITGCGAKPAIFLRGVGLHSCIVGALTGSTGNTDVGLDLTHAQGCKIYLPSTPTVTGSAGDVRLANGTIITWATAAAGRIDTNGNVLWGSGNYPGGS